METLILVVDFEKGFCGSRTVTDIDSKFANPDEVKAYLGREFPGFKFDDVLFIENNKIVAEWWGGRR